MMQELETGGFDVAFLIGYHTVADHTEGVMTHTMTGQVLEVRLNGRLASETVLSAAIAGYFQVPVGLAIGDGIYPRMLARGSSRRRAGSSPTSPAPSRSSSTHR